MFDIHAYAGFLKNARRVESSDAEECAVVIEDFLLFCKIKNGAEPRDITAKDAVSYIVEKRGPGADINKTIGILTDYTYYIKNKELVSEFVLLRDGLGVFDKTGELTKTYEPAAWERVFKSAEIPGAGSTLDEMSAFTRGIEKKMLDAMPRERLEFIMGKNAHGWQPEWVWDEHAKLAEAGTLDKYLDMKHDEFIKELEGYRDSGEFFFTQEMDDSVVAFARDHLKTVRKGDKLIYKRAPYLMKEYLNAAENKMKRYYACHCPWKRNSILQEESPLTHSMCCCCLGHAKKPFDFAFKQEIDGRVISTMMDDGCSVCTYEYTIPEEIMEAFT